MTKLTKEQIEQERVKFEEFLRKTTEPKYCKHNGAFYSYTTAENQWTGWLARAELDNGE